MRKLVLVGVSLLLTSIATAQEHTDRPSPAPIPSQTQTQLQRYISDAGRYSVMLPGQPKLSTQNITSPTGQPMTQYMAMAVDGGVLLMIGYFDYGADVVFNLDKARNGMVESIKGALLEEQSASLGGAPGRELKIAGRTDDGIEFINRARFYDIAPRVYVLQCMVQKSQDSPAAAERCEQFFDSFRVRTGGPG